jgi:hypothetical protein
MRPKSKNRIDSEADTATIALVDAALSRACHREFFTRDEAVQLFCDIQTSIHDPVRGAKVASAVNDAVVTFQQEQLLDADRVADALLTTRSSRPRWRPRTECTEGVPLMGDHAEDREAVEFGGEAPTKASVASSTTSP